MTSFYLLLIINLCIVGRKRHGNQKYFWVVGGNEQCKLKGELVCFVGETDKTIAVLKLCVHLLEVF